MATTILPTVPAVSVMPLASLMSSPAKFNTETLPQSINGDSSPQIPIPSAKPDEHNARPSPDSPSALDLSPSPQEGDGFPLFPLLPTELRLAIWSQALHAPRVVHIRFRPTIRALNAPQVSAQDALSSLSLTNHEAHSVTTAHLARHGRSQQRTDPDSRSASPDLRHPPPQALLNFRADLRAGLRSLALSGAHVRPSTDYLFLDGFHAWLPSVLEAAWAGDVSNPFGATTRHSLLGKFRRICVRAQDVANAVGLYCLSGAAAIVTFHWFDFLGGLVVDGRGRDVKEVSDGDEAEREDGKEKRQEKEWDPQDGAEEYIVLFGAETSPSASSGSSTPKTENTSDASDLPWDPSHLRRTTVPDPELVAAIGRRTCASTAKRCSCPQKFVGDGAWIEVLKYCWAGWEKDAAARGLPFPKLVFANVVTGDEDGKTGRRAHEEVSCTLHDTCRALLH
jgi:hypothetical protein